MEALQKRMTKTLISMSGGKDSTALALLAIERGAENLEFVFADTGHEHELTYEYLDYLRDKLGITIQVVKADFSRRIETRRNNLRDKWTADGISDERIQQVLDLLHPTGNPFLDLCMLKGRFPSTRGRFCSQELKHLPILQLTNQWMAEGWEVESWQGVRADESHSRSKLPEREECERKDYSTGAELNIYRPILKWNVDDVFAMHEKHGIKPNPLYKLGMGRVGCMPCIHARKDELREIGKRFPDEIDRVSKWEKIVAEVSKRGFASFFSSDRTPEGRELTEKGVVTEMPQIWQVVDWAKTGRGGRNYDLFAYEEPEMCSSIYGLCE